MSILNKKALLSASSGKESTIDISIRELNQKERQKIALKTLGLFWGLSIASIPLPPIHWLTVPGFFLFGIYWSMKKYRETRHFQAITVKCPECGKEMPCAEQYAQSPLALTCPSCKYNLKLSWTE